MSRRNALGISVAAATAAVSLVLTLAAVPASASRRPAAAVPAVSSLSAIACPTATKCIAVGTDTDGNGQTAVVDATSGATTVWSGSLTNETLSAIGCAVPTDCIALAGDTVARVAVASGAASVSATLTAPADELAELDRIACPNTTECFGVGFIGTEVHSKALIAHFSATGGLLGTTDEATASGVGAIACPTTTLCLIAAADRSNPEKIQLLSNGHPGAGIALPAKTFIQDMACFQSVACYAIGGSTTTSKVDVLYKLDPTSGKLESTRALSGGFGGDGIACPTASECILTGFTGSKPAIIIVTGGVPGAPRRIGGTSVSDVACASSDACYVVGQDNSGTIAAGLVEKV